MFCVIYRSSKRDQTYLYVEKKDDFSRVPEELMKGFGQPTLAMMLPLDGRKKLVNADLEKVKQALTEQGYYPTSGDGRTCAQSHRGLWRRVGSDPA